MHAVMAESLIRLAPLVVLIAGALAIRRSRDWALIPLVGGLFLVDYVLLNITVWAPGSHLSTSHWNWEGKFASILFGLAALTLAPQWLVDRIGLFRLPTPSRWLPVLLILAVYLGARIYLLSKYGGESFDLDSVLYQATMPGLDEELWFRGILWGLLAYSLDPEASENGTMPWLTLLTTTILFGWVHAASIGVSGFEFDWERFMWPTLSGFVFGLLQGVGRSLWVPIFAHNAGNTLSWLGLFRPQ